MRLTLSAAAAPDLPLRSLAAGASRRGFDGLEAVIDSNGLHPRDLDQPLEGCTLAAIRTETLDAVLSRDTLALARRHVVPVIVAPDVVPRDRAVEVRQRYDREGVTLWLAETEWTRASTRSDAGAFAWEPDADLVGTSISAEGLRIVRRHARAVRLAGGGPEPVRGRGRDVGELSFALATSGYDGLLVLAPSDRSMLGDWTEWLLASDDAPLRTAVPIANDGGETFALDVRDVEPKHRLPTILGAYDALGTGARLQLTVDHDPLCMFYTLRAREPEGSFAFRYLDAGPEVWRVEVQRRAAAETARVAG